MWGRGLGVCNNGSVQLCRLQCADMYVDWKGWKDMSLGGKREEGREAGSWVQRDAVTAQQRGCKYLPPSHDSPPPIAAPAQSHMLAGTEIYKGPLTCRGALPSFLPFCICLPRALTHSTI